MKKIIYLAIAAIMCAASSTAQTSASAYSDTTLNTDTAYATFKAVPSNIKSFQLDFSRITGTLPTPSTAFANSGAYAILQGTNTGRTWFDVNTDSLRITNQALNSKSWVITSTSYIGYRVRVIIPSGTSTTQAALTFCRRQDEQ